MRISIVRWRRAWLLSWIERWDVKSSQTLWFWVFLLFLFICGKLKDWKTGSKLTFSSGNAYEEKISVLKKEKHSCLRRDQICLTRGKNGSSSISGWGRILCITEDCTMFRNHLKKRQRNIESQISHVLAPLGCCGNSLMDSSRIHFRWLPWLWIPSQILISSQTS